jgi:hypothetical protein
MEVNDLLPIVFNFEFYFPQRYWLPFVCFWATLLQVCQRLLATLRQICFRVSGGIGNPLIKSLEGIGNFFIYCSTFL